jgi:hypothetical protein
MKINVTTPIKDYQGKDIVNGEEPVTLRGLIDTSINTTIDGEVLTADAKSKLFQIGIKLWSGTDLDFTHDQLALIQERGGKALTSLAYGRLCELIDPQPANLATTPKNDDLVNAG